MSQNNTIEKRIKDYLKELEQNLGEIKSIGLHTGISGVALFFLYAYKSKIIEKEKVNIILKVLFEKIENEEISYSLSDGIIGVGIVIQKFINEGFIEDKYNDFLKSIDRIINPITIQMFKKNRYDYLHGGLGAIDYLLKREKYLDNSFVIKKSLRILLENKIHDEFGISWESVIDRERGAKKSEVHRPLGAAHGQASILHILTKLYINEYLNNQKIILSLSKWILLQQDFKRDRYTIFPPRLINENFTDRNSRLGWCTGDLGILYPLFLSSKKMSFNNLNKRVIDMLLYTSKMKDLDSCVVVDNGFCHGVAGIVHIYHKLYIETGIDTFQKSFMFWLEILLEKREKLEKNLPFRYDMNAGIAGIGLVLISIINPTLDTNWDSYFVLS